MKRVLFSFMFFCLCGWMQAQTPPEESKYPWPVHNAELTYNAAVRLVCINATPTTWGTDEEAVSDPITYEFYFGEDQGSLDKISDPEKIVVTPNMAANSATVTVASFVYAPVTPLEPGKSYFWRVDATNAQGTTPSAVWTFKAGDGALVDIGYIFKSADDEYRTLGTDPTAEMITGLGLYTPTNYPANTGVALIPVPDTQRPIAPQTVNQGTALELTFTPPATTNVNNDRGVYFPNNSSWPNTPYYRAEGAVVTMTGPGNDEKKITKVFINGTSAATDAGANVGVLFSNMLDFDENSIVGYASVSLPNLRQLVAGDHIIDAPEGTMSFSMKYSSTKLTEVAPGNYKVDPAGEITVSGAGARVTYIGAILQDNVVVTACTDPMPANNVSVRLQPSITLSWKLAAGETADGFEVYAGASTGSMSKVEGDIIQPASVAEVGTYSIKYTPDASFASENYHYWRVDAINGDETTEGRVWRFRPVAIETGDLADVGLDFDGFSNAYTTAESNVGMTGTTDVADAKTVFTDSQKEVVFTPVNTGFASDNGGYLRAPNTPTWRLTDATKYIDVALNAGSIQAKRLIKSLVINGTDAQPNGTQRTSPVILFSDKPAFDENSILGYRQVTLGICRTAHGSSTTSVFEIPHRSQAAIVVDAPTGAQSARVYYSVQLSQTGNVYKIDSEGDIALTAGNQSRIAYLGVEFIALENDNTIRSMTIEGKAAKINQADGTITVTLPVKEVDFIIDYALNHKDATADFESGTTHNFETPLEIAVTAPNGDVKTYTVSVELPEPPTVGDILPLTGPSRNIAIVTADNEGVGTQAYDEASHSRFKDAFKEHHVTFFTAGSTELSLPEYKEIYGGFDLVVVHPTVSGNNAHLKGMKQLVGEMPFLNLKPYAYTATDAARWQWNAPSNPANGETPFVNIPELVQNHQIFAGINLAGDDKDELTLYSVETATKSPNNIQRAGPMPFTGSGWNAEWNDFNHQLASHLGVGNTQTHEINLDKPEAKYLMIGISTELGGLVDLSDDAITLLKNSIHYLTNPEWYYDYATNDPVGGIVSSSNNIDIQFNTFDENQTFTANEYVYVEKENWPSVKLIPGGGTNNMEIRPAEAAGYHCDWLPGGVRYNNNANAAEIQFDEPVQKLVIYGASGSGSTDVGMVVTILKASDRSVLKAATEVKLGYSSYNPDTGAGGERTGCKIEMEDLDFMLNDEPFIVRVTRTGATLYLMRVYAEPVGGGGGEVPALNDDNTLEKLSVTGLVLTGSPSRELTLTPAFSPEVTDYSLRVNNVGSDVTIAATVNNRRALMMTKDPGTKDLAIGENVFPIRIYAENGDLRTYTVSIDHYALKNITITFNANGGELPPDVPAMLSVLQEHQLNDFPTPVEREGFGFLGWNTAQNGQGSMVMEGDICNFDNDITLYAQYSVPTYTVTFNTNSSGAVQAPPAKRDIPHGTAVGTLPTLDKWGDKTHNGWNEKADGTGVTYTAETVITSSFTMYAVWKEPDTPPTGVTELVWDNLKIYPNPATSVLSVSGLEGGELITIIDAGGRICLQIKATGVKEDIAVSDFSKGAYLVKITKGSAEKVMKMVVN